MSICRMFPIALWSSSGFKKLWKLAGTLAAIIFLFSLALNNDISLSLGSLYDLKLSKGSNSSFPNLGWTSLGFSRNKDGNSLLKLSQFSSEESQGMSEDDTFDDSQFQFYDSLRHQSNNDKSLPDGLTAIVNKKFIVDTPGCKIPDFNPYHPSIKAYIYKAPKIDCKSSKIGDVTTSSKNILYFYPEKLPLKSYFEFVKNSSRSKVLNHPPYEKVTFPNETKSQSPRRPVIQSEDHIIVNHMKAYLASKIKCCYKIIERSIQKGGKLSPGYDGSFKYSEQCRKIVQFETTINNDCIVVYCYATGIIYKNVHHFIQSTKGVQHVSNVSGTQYNLNEASKMRHNRSTKFLEEEEDSSLSVIIFGTDSVSRLNFLRKLPKTYKYLMENLEALEFRGFNKHGDNTFPNLIPILTSLSSEQLKNHSCLPAVGPKVFDNCPWIWRDFKRKGYSTAFMEDSPWMGIFNYNNPGFMEPPTDHYGRPYFLASEKLIGKKQKGNSNVCQGNKLSLQVLHNYSLEFMQANYNSPTFSLFWSASITHDFVNFAGLADDPHTTYLKSLEEMGAFNRSVLIFMSDHGMRWGKLRKTHLGALEERLPFFFIVFPKWFKHSYLSAYSNLRKNTKLLVSNFDVYETLQDIVNKNYGNESYTDSKSLNNFRGISLFKEIPGNRTCEDAGIPQHYCTCQEMKEIDEEDFTVVKAMNFTMNFINKELEIYKSCSVYTNITALSSLISIWNGQNPFSSAASKDPPYRTLFLQLKLNPGNAVIEATIKDGNFSNQPFEILGEVSRINAYGNQSHCITHDVLRKFCVCLDTLNDDERGTAYSKE